MMFTWIRRNLFPREERYSEVRELGFYPKNQIANVPKDEQIDLSLFERIPKYEFQKKAAQYDNSLKIIFSV